MFKDLIINSFSYSCSCGPYGCERMYQEQVSAVASRQELERAIDMLREGDKLVVTKLDRLGS